MLLLLQAMQRGDSATARWDVFLSHAGEQKKEFVDLMHAWLTEVYRLKCFLDEHSLRRRNLRFLVANGEMLEACISRLNIFSNINCLFRFLALNTFVQYIEFHRNPSRCLLRVN